MKNPGAFIELMVIANKIPYERRKRLDSHGISWREIAESEFIELPVKVIENNDLMQHGISKPQNKEVRQEYKSISDINFDKVKFQNSFDGCSHEIKEIFTLLLKAIDVLPVNKYPTNKPDFRLQKRNIFCEFVLWPRKNTIQINLRVDSKFIYSKIIKLEEINDPSKPGKRWLKFFLNDNRELNEALRLINEVYEFSD
jgi:hypothetical protein